MSLEAELYLAELLDELTSGASVGRAGVEDHAGTRERILDAAIEIFAARGFGSCTMRDLAGAVGIKAPGIYAHFSSKEAILTEAMVHALVGFLAYVTPPAAAANAAERLRETVRRHVRYQLEHLSATRANDLLLNSKSLGEYLPPDDYVRVAEVQRAYYRLVRARVEAALPTGSPIDPRVSTFAVINMCDMVTSWYQTDGGMTVDEVADQYWYLVSGMLRLPG